MHSLNKINMEGFQVAQEYLKTLSINDCANSLNLSSEEVAKYLEKREIKCYIDRVFSEQAYMSRDRIAETLTSLIDKKLEELDEAGIGSKYDIMDLLKFAHQMSLAERKLAIEEAKVQHQLNVQINTQVNYGSNWMQLVEKLTND